MKRSKTLEDNLRRFNLGRKIYNEAIYDYTHPENPRYNPRIHETRVNGLGETAFWEGLGYLSALFENTFKHPIAMYKMVVLRK